MQNGYHPSADTHDLQQYKPNRMCEAEQPIPSRLPMSPPLSLLYPLDP